MRYAVALLLTLVIMALIGTFGKSVHAEHGQIRVQQVFYDQNSSTRFYVLDDSQWTTPCYAITTTSGTSIACR
jgi:hypothetical protein